MFGRTSHRLGSGPVAVLRIRRNVTASPTFAATITVATGLGLEPGRPALGLRAHSTELVEKPHAPRIGAAGNPKAAAHRALGLTATINGVIGQFGDLAQYLLGWKDTERTPGSPPGKGAAAPTPGPQDVPSDSATPSDAASASPSDSASPSVDVSPKASDSTGPTTTPAPTPGPTDSPTAMASP